MKQIIMNKYEEKSKKSYNRKAVNYEETFDGKFTKKFKRKLLECTSIRDGNNVLDVACGNGKLCDNAPFEEEKMDVVTVCAAFHHFPDVNRFAEEMFRILKPNGIIYIAEVYLPRFCRIICNPFIKFSPAGDVRFYAPDEIIDCFSKVGFEKDNVSIEGMVQIVSMRKRGEFR